MNRTVLPVAAALALLAAAPAHAATVSVGSVTFSDGGTLDGVMKYTAAAGETNRLTITRTSESKVTVTDPGATVTPGAKCTGVDTHTATCTSDGGAKVTLADLDDTLKTVGEVGTTDVSGGDGDDQLQGTGFFDGGPGKDTMLGGDGEDAFVDSDTDADLIDGGDGQDSITYAARTEPLEITTGKTSDGDMLTSIEAVTGTKFDDEITTGDTDDAIDGGPGDDTIRSGAGNDQLTGGRGADDLDAGAGNDSFTPDPGIDQIQCGTGRDAVDRPSPREYLRNCESLAFEGLGSEGLSELIVKLTPKKLGTGVLRYPFGCEEDAAAGSTAACSNTVTFTDRKGRVLDSGRTGSRKHYTDLRLTLLGAQLGARKAGVRATGAIRFSNGKTRKWTFNFRLPSGY